MTDSLGALVRKEWSPLLLQGFTITDEERGRVVLESAAVQVVATHDPRGEVDVTVASLSGEWPNCWSYSRMVGTASVGRLLEIALEEMRAEPAVLNGDSQYFERLGADNGALAHVWAEYHAGRGPRPGGMHFP